MYCIEKNFLSLSSPFPVSFIPGGATHSSWDTPLYNHPYSGFPAGPSHVNLSSKRLLGYRSIHLRHKGLSRDVMNIPHALGKEREGHLTSFRGPVLQIQSVSLASCNGGLIHFNQLCNDGAGRCYWDTSLFEALPGDLLDSICRTSARVEHTLFGVSSIGHPRDHGHLP